MMRTLFFSVLVILVLIPLIPSILSDPLNQPLGDFDIPIWVKNTAGWWSDDKIPDSSFIETIEFLIKDEIITVEIPDLDSEVTNEVPIWVKNTAGWWSDDKIPDVTFIASIRYLMSQGIIHVEREQVEEPEIVLEEIKEFHIVVNEHNCGECLNWAHVGGQYVFQIETFDEFRGSPTDDVAITATIISKDGEVRYNFGTISTEDGVYRNSITIPSMDWYAENTLSVTAERNGIEKTVEKEFDVFRAESKQHCVKILCYTINSVSSVADGTNLNGVRGVETFTIGASTYVIAAADESDKIVIYDISDPSNPTSVGRATHNSETFSELDAPYEVAIATIGGSTYAVVAGSIDDGIEIIDISIPSSPSSVGRMTDADDSSTRELNGANGVAITTIGSSTYAIVGGYHDDGISIIDISTPASPVYVSELEDGTDTGVCTAANGERCLDGPRDVEIETIRGFTYAIVASHKDSAITIIDITVVSNPTIVASMYNSSTKELAAAKGISIATIDGSTYVVVGSTTDDGIEIIKIMHSYN